MFLKTYQSPQKTTTTQKIKFSNKDFFSKYDQIRRFLRIWSHLLKKSLMENFTFCAVYLVHYCLECKLFMTILGDNSKAFIGRFSAKKVDLNYLANFTGKYVAILLLRLYLWQSSRVLCRKCSTKWIFLKISQSSQ